MNRYDYTLPPITINEIMVKQPSQIYDWGHNYLGATDIYNITKGDGVAIAILDTAGVFEHEDLNSNALNNLGKNFSDSPVLTDLHGHGHLCAGCAAAVDNGVGVIGIAPGAKLIPVKVANDQGGAMDSWIDKGIRYIADLDIPYYKVISISLGGPGYSKTLEASIKYATSKGCFVVIAAGNSGSGTGSTVNTPGNIKDAITVGAIDPSEMVAKFSSRGPELDVVAPGVNISSTWRNNLYGKFNGTSFATPIIAGLIALLKSAYPHQLKNQAIMHEFLTKHAKDLGTKGFDIDTGFGSTIVKDYMNKFEEDKPGDENPFPYVTYEFEYTITCAYRDHLATFNTPAFNVKGDSLSITINIGLRSEDNNLERDLDRLYSFIEAKVISFYDDRLVVGASDTQLIDALSKISVMQVLRKPNCNIANFASDILDSTRIATEKFNADFKIESLTLEDSRHRKVKVL